MGGSSYRQRRIKSWSPVTMRRCARASGDGGDSARSQSTAFTITVSASERRPANATTIGTLLPCSPSRAGSHGRRNADATGPWSTASRTKARCGCCVRAHRHTAEQKSAKAGKLTTPLTLLTSISNAVGGVVCGVAICFRIRARRAR
eukprot:5224587-Prymnesium_polylepis.1